MALLAHVARGLAGCGSGVRDADDVPAMRGAARLGLVLRDVQLVSSEARVILYCKRVDCGAGYASVGEVPLVCPSCNQPTRWGSSPPHAQDGIAAVIWTEKDRRLLRSFRIDPEG